jgi:DnaJ like chaperone protein
LYPHKVKIVSGMTGWILGGFKLCVVGICLGAYIDSAAASMQKKAAKSAYRRNIVLLLAAVMKADNRVSRAELQYVRMFLLRNFGKQHASEMLKWMNGILKQKDVPLEPACHRIRDGMKYASRLQFMYVLTHIAQIDRNTDSRTWQLLDLIAVQTGISDADRKSIRSIFHEETSYTRSSRMRTTYPDSLMQAYSFLGVDRNDDIAVIKKAYRTKAILFHPDKVGYLGEDIKQSANERFQRLNEAYKIIKNDKGFV